jgi:pimeloyl-ACP methyl ester carboxylesterase
MQKVMLQSVELENGERIYYRESGSGEIPFVMLHGNMTSSVHLDVLFDRMPNELRVIAPDLRGFGESTYKNEINSLEDFADDVIEVINQLGIGEFYLGGWSTGGGIAMEIAAKLPNRVLGLVTIESVGIQGYPMFKKDEQGQPIIGEFIHTKDEIAADPVQVIPVLQAYEQKNKEVMRAIWNAAIYTQKQPDEERYEMYLDDMMTQRNLVDVDYSLVYFNISHRHNGVVEGNGRIDQIQCPVLVFQGDLDYVVPPTMGEGIRDALGEKATYVHGDWGHSPFIDIPDMLCERIVSFLKTKSE